MSHTIHDILNAQYEYVNNLKEEVKDVIREYTGNLYLELNKSLRENKNIEKFKYEIDILDAVFRSCPVTTTPITVYRRIYGKEFVNDLKSYLSTTYDLESIFGSNKLFIILEILIPPGSKILPIEFISDELNEKEILLDRFTKLYVSNMTYRDGIKYYNLVYLPGEEIKIDTTYKQIEGFFSVEEWTNKIIDKVDKDIVELYDNDSQIVISTIVEMYYSTRNVPIKAIKMAEEKVDLIEWV